MFCTASGRAYLSALAERDVEELLGRCQLQAFTPNTVTDLEVLHTLVREARRNGYAWANEEYYRGDINVAAPVRDAKGHPLGAINVSLPTSRWTLDIGRERMAPLLLETVRAIASSAPT
jgi:IclR family transcriptional regulator, pca regulon regulatory protein